MMPSTVIGGGSDWKVGMAEDDSLTSAIWEAACTEILLDTMLPFTVIVFIGAVDQYRSNRN